MTSLLLRLSIAMAAILLASCATTSNEGQMLIDSGNWRDGLAKMEAALRERPNDPELRIQYHRQRELVVNRLIGLASADFAASRFDAAELSYRQVLSVEPSNSRASGGIAAIEAARRHSELVAEARKKLETGDTTSAELMVKSILTENPAHVDARALDRELRERERRIAMTTPVLKSKLEKPVNLEFRDAPLKLVIEALSRSAGINFILDRDVRPDLKATIFVRSVRVEDAIELILAPNQLDSKVLSENTLLIYPNTPQKQREHQELVLKTFHLGNADPKQTINMIRTMLKTKELFIDERINLLVMRDTPDAIRLAEKLIAAQDLAEPEVMLEVDVVEVARQKVLDLGIKYPGVFTGPTGTLENIRQISDARIAVDTGLAATIKQEISDGKILASPRIRVRNREKARVHIGDRVPVISATVTPSTGTPVVTEQVQYLDVGLKLDVEPSVHLDDNVAIKIGLEVSTFTRLATTANGTTPIQVKTRNATTVLRLRDGETQVLMGLIREDEDNTGSGIPFLSTPPLLDRIFGTKKTDARSNEIILLITPHVVRNLRRPDATLAEIWSGTEASVRTRPPVVQPIAASAGTQVAAAAPTPAVTAPPVPLVLSWTAPATAKAGQEVTVALKGRSAGPLKGASIQLRFDPSELQVLAVEDGGFFKQGGAATVFTPRIDAAIGVVFATASLAGAGSAQGEGNLITLRVKPLFAPGKSRLQVTSVIGLDTQSRRVPIEGAVPIEIAIEP